MLNWELTVNWPEQQIQDHIFWHFKKPFLSFLLQGFCVCVCFLSCVYVYESIKHTLMSVCLLSHSSSFFHYVIVSLLLSGSVRSGVMVANTNQFNWETLLLFMTACCPKTQFVCCRSQRRRLSGSCLARSLRRRPPSTLGATMVTATTARPAMGPLRATSHHPPPRYHPSEFNVRISSYASTMLGAPLR